MECAQALSEQFVKCAYYFERPGLAPIHDEVFFNYNDIYGVYESLWLSATWPIKVLMTAKPDTRSDTLNWEARFEIEDGVTEWVRSLWTVSGEAAFTRNVEIRTSRQATPDWMHWMTESVSRLD